MSESDATERAIKQIDVRNVFHTGNRQIEVRSLVPYSEQRPLRAEWWKGKEVYIIGEDGLGNVLLRHCDGTVRYFDHTKNRDEVIAPSVRAFLFNLQPRE